MTPSPRSGSLRDLNKARLRRRIIESATSLVASRGLDAVTADSIAAEAEVGRATFFRYFDSKEAAIIVGFYEQRLTALVGMLGLAPKALAPMDAVIWTFRELGKRAEKELKLVRLHARMVSSSPVLRAKAFEYHSRYEQAIADAVSPRFKRVRATDPRPRLLAAAALAVIQGCVEYWAASRESLDLGELVLSGLDQLKAGFPEAA